MRRLVSLLCVLALTACAGGAARTSLPLAGPLSEPGGADSVASGAARNAGHHGRIQLSTPSLTFTATGWSATQVVTTTWTDDSRKAAGSSDTSVATVSPPYQLAQWFAPGTYRASYWITPVGAGTATITFSDHDGAEYTQLNLTVTAPPTGSLYVAGAAEVDAFPAAANGSTAPLRRIKGFYTAFAPPAHAWSNAGAVGALPDGTLYVLQNALAGPGNFVCSAIAESATADGASGFLNRFSCVGGSGYGVAPGPAGEVDILVLGYAGRPVVQRFDGSGHLKSSLTTPGTGVGGLATDKDGNIFVSASTATTTFTGQVLEYAAGAADGAAPIRTIAAPPGDYFGPIAVAPDGTLYATLVVPNLAAGSSTNSIDAFAPGATSPSRTLGPFAADAVAALACDKGGELYVALNSSAQPTARVDVYAPGATGNAAPIRTIPNPIPADTVGGTTIVGISLGPPQEAPPEQVLGRRRHP
jgi:hypothetical protein